MTKRARAQQLSLRADSQSVMFYFAVTSAVFYFSEVVVSAGGERNYVNISIMHYIMNAIFDPIHAHARPPIKAAGFGFILFYFA